MALVALGPTGRCRGSERPATHTINVEQRAEACFHGTCTIFRISHLCRVGATRQSAPPSCCWLPMGRTSTSSKRGACWSPLSSSRSLPAWGRHPHGSAISRTAFGGCWKRRCDAGIPKASSTVGHRLSLSTRGSVRTRRRKKRQRFPWLSPWTGKAEHRSDSPDRTRSPTRCRMEVGSACSSARMRRRDDGSGGWRGAAGPAALSLEH